KFEHVMFAGFTHEPAVLLCEKLQTILPQSLTKFFFSDNGSTAVEIALKMAHQYWFNKGETKRRLYLSFDGGYHGDTVGAMSVGKTSHFHKPFQNLLFDIISIPFPHTWIDDTQVLEKEKLALDYLAKQLKEKGHNISAIILEPIVQGASGMRMCRPEFIRAVINQVKQYDILVIYDEVMTGFGRLGTYFAAEQVGIDPDFICISKGITGGFLPLALTVTTKNIYNEFLGSTLDKAFTHGHSYAGNPIACSAGVASFDILTSTETNTAFKQMAQSHQKGLVNLHNKHSNIINNIRFRGTVAAFEVNSTNSLTNYLKAEFLKRGLLLRPIGNTIYMIPPYSVTMAEIDNAYSIIAEVIKEADKNGVL
ncbi:MAG: adenosylmethionine--8-amino-7-oxononanoate transaminase, partial [Legionellales bacterium]|nr:adenosylmethionine--8-amino-7-oxononanoate transaminase [Legionellales bacterium]